MNKMDFLERKVFKQGMEDGITDRQFLACKAAEKAARDAKHNKNIGLTSAIAAIVAAVGTVISLFI